MEKFRFKCHWLLGEPSFEDAGFGLSRTYWLARHILRERKMLDKVDIYQGTKLIATFYK